MADEPEEALDERMERIQRRAENFRELLRDGDEVTIAFSDGEVHVAESYRSVFERKHAKLYGRLICIEAQLSTGWLPYFLGLSVVIMLNSQFYLFLAAKGGRLFALAAIPFHLLFHFYNGISFLIGLARYSLRRAATAPRDAVSAPSNR